MIPRTMPKFLTMRYPGSSTAEVTIPASTLAISVLLGTMFTGGILTVPTPLCEQLPLLCSGKRGDSLLFFGVLAGLARSIPDLGGFAVARLRAPAIAYRSGILLAACGRAMPVQRHRARSRAQSSVAYGIRAPELRNLFYSCFGLRSGPRNT